MIEKNEGDSLKQKYVEGFIDCASAVFYFSTDYKSDITDEDFVLVKEYGNRIDIRDIIQ